MERPLVEMLPRSSVGAEHKWDLTILFADVAAWEIALRAQNEALLGLAAQQRAGLPREPQALAEVLDHLFEMRLEITRIWSYAARLHDEDTRCAAPRGMLEQAQRLYTEYQTRTAFVEPLLLSWSDEELEALQSVSALSHYSRFFLGLRRSKPHVLSEPEERILARAGLVGGVPSAAYRTFTDSDLEYPLFTDSSGSEQRLRPHAFQRYRQSTDRDERQRAFSLFFGTYRTYRNTFATLLAGGAKFNEFAASCRAYDSSLEAALSPNEIPTSFYRGLIDEVRAGLPLFERYLALRARRLGLEGDLGYPDLYVPIVEPPGDAFRYRDAVERVLSAVEPLGEAYVEQMREALADGSGWIDVLPNLGKRSGAYSSCVYGAHPLVLLNHADDWRSSSTLAHEMGHALHSYFSNASQPYAKAQYPTFLAEIASTVNEILLVEAQIAAAPDEARRAYYHAEFIEAFRATVFRQSLFAEFESELYRLIESGVGVTADLLDETYLGLLRLYYGHEAGTMRIDELFAVEWASVPHFYYNFYVFQYASGFIAATALVERMRRDPTAAARYLRELLCAGGSDDPLVLLRRAGVDLSSPEPYRLAMGAFASHLAALEAYSG
ncbi:MAG: oligoendopeptidase F family protein [Myxococcales bacterium]|nr:oligoendopeptidase F family protein [Myxococcales bacterium]